jgi:hypothetical protein
MFTKGRHADARHEHVHAHLLKIKLFSQYNDFVVTIGQG